MSVRVRRSVVSAALVTASLASALMGTGAGSAQASVGSTVVSIAAANLKVTASGRNSAGGYGFYNRADENWCADFGKWVWAQDGVDVRGLTAGAGSFTGYGSGLHRTPHVGDAGVFEFNGADWASHVAIVSAVNSDGTVSTTGGNQGSSDRAKSSSPRERSRRTVRTVPSGSAVMSAPSAGKT
ncbi:CHAP domain-containing protein [Streptomyces goshikiensis]|uniref:CHAP domain-containing protein n=1 Tax=Streptomyces goshikiensis TaxID=1942 RepID=UPI0037BCF688